MSVLITKITIGLVWTVQLHFVRASKHLRNAFPIGETMGQAASSRKTADVLRKTIEQLEADPTVEANDPAFISLKCSLLARILELESSRAHVEAVIHLVEPENAESAVADQSGEDNEDSAIA